MSKKPKIQETDPHKIDHKHIMDAIMISGIKGSYHDPRAGLNFLVTRDKFFSDEWHEAGHSFISQRGTLGLVLTFLSAIIHVLFNEIYYGESSKEENEKQRKVFGKIKTLRHMMMNRFHLSHEIYAMSTEIRGILESSFSKGGFVPDLEKIATDNLIEMHQAIKSEGDEIHQNAMNIIIQFTEVYGNFFYSKIASEHILNEGSCLIANIDPGEIFFETDKKFSFELPDVNSIYTELIKYPPDWAPQFHVLKMNSAITRIVVERISKLSPQKNIYNDLKMLGYWIGDIKALLPLGKYKRLFDSIMASTLSFVLIGGDERQNQLKKYVDFEEVDEQDYRKALEGSDFHEFINFAEKSIGMKVPDKTEIIDQEPLIIPPPLTMTLDGEGLKLYIRDDVNIPNAFFHMAYRSAEMGITEFFISPYHSKPILCFYNECEFGNDSCTKGPYDCYVSCKIRELLNFYFSNTQERFEPVLICCKKNSASFVEFKDWDFKPEVSCELPFKLIPFRPKLRGLKIKKSV